MKSIAIVTGASSGIGREFVRQFNLGMGGLLDELWLIARREDILTEVAASSEIPCHVIPLDLCMSSSFDTVSELLASEHDLRVQWLVNSAGFGKVGSFSSISRADNADMVRLNCLATVEMCYAALPYMGPGTRIVNLASVAGFMPLPTMNVYAATKDFVINFSLALDADLADGGIRVCAVCPRWMKTDFLSRIGDERDYRAMTFIGFDDPARVVRRALHASVLGQTLYIPSVSMKLARAATKVLPAGVTLLAMHAITKRKRSGN